MPAGDLVTAPYQVELRGLLMGSGTVYAIGPAPAVIEGVGGIAPVKSADVELAHQDGSYGANDYQGVRVITVPIIIRSGSMAASNSALDALTTAWAPSTTDIALWWRLPRSDNKRSWVMGRPRACTPEYRLWKGGAIPVLCTFYALDPTITTVI